MTSAASLTVAMGLAAALAWGAGDFSGGLASRRATALAVTIWAEIIGLAMLALFALGADEPALSARNWALAGVSGIAGGIGLSLLYHALASGQMTIAAPVSGVVGAVLPVLIGAVTLGLPSPAAIIGLVLALVAIGLVASGDGGEKTAQVNLAQLRLPLIAGVNFGLYFVLIHWASEESTYAPLIAARITSVLFLLCAAILTRQPWKPPLAGIGLVALCGILDTGANWFYVSAANHGRMDIAAVLGSLYPGVTALLAWLILKERLNRPQLWGVAFAFAAIVLISIQV